MHSSMVGRQQLLLTGHDTELYQGCLVLVQVVLNLPEDSSSTVMVIFGHLLASLLLISGVA